MLHCWELDPDERPKFMELATTLQSMFLNAKVSLFFVKILHKYTKYRRCTVCFMYFL